MRTVRPSGNEVARDRVLRSAGYDPLLVTGGADGENIAVVVPVDIRERAESAYARARAKAILRHPALGDPTASPLATGCGCSSCCKLCWKPFSGGLRDSDCRTISVDCKTGGVEVQGLNPNYCACSFGYCGGLDIRMGHSGGKTSDAPTPQECETGIPSSPGEGWTCQIICDGAFFDLPMDPSDIGPVSCSCGPLNPSCWGAALSCAECRQRAESLRSGLLEGHFRALCLLHLCAGPP